MTERETDGREQSAERWTTIRIDAGSAREEAIAALFAAGAQGVHEDGRHLVTHFPPGADVDAVRDSILAMVPGADIECASTEPVDWTEAWKDKIGAHQLRTLTVSPPWLAEGRDPLRTIVIEPGMAFGTGEHATTRGVVRLLHDVVREGDIIADLGAGTAVLAIAAVKLGAHRALAIELDPDAIGNAEENVARNGMVGRVHVVEGNATLLLPLAAPVNVVVANIISSVLLEMLGTIEDALAPNGRVILSGLLFEEREMMLAALGARGWRITAEDREDAWWTVAAVPKGDAPTWSRSP